MVEDLDADSAYPIQVAGVDVGSNAMRLLVARFTGRDRFQPVETLRLPVRLPLASLRSTIETLSRMSYRQRVEELGLREDRADVILPAAMVYEKLATLSGVEEIRVPYVGLKDGLVLDLVESRLNPNGSEARREQQVRAACMALGRRYFFDEDHALQVTELCLSIFDQIRSLHGHGTEERRILLAAALLHDIGCFIGRKGHHKHSMYLILNAEIPGLEGREQELASVVARYHRKSEPGNRHPEFVALSSEEQVKVQSLAGLRSGMDPVHLQLCPGARSRALLPPRSGNCPGAHSGRSAGAEVFRSWHGSGAQQRPRGEFPALSGQNHDPIRATGSGIRFHGHRGGRQCHLRAPGSGARPGGRSHRSGHVPKGGPMNAKSCYLAPPPGVDLDCLPGRLVVIEGPDAAGRSTQVEQLSQWLQRKGYAVAQVGLKRSDLVAEELEQASRGNVLSPRTMALFYATDFYDQLENHILPALRAGFIVLADRYIYTLIARAVVRDMNPAWVEAIYSRALVPDAVFYLSVSTQALVERTLWKYGTLDYWESGMDMGLSREWHDSFQKYQRRMRMAFKGLMNRHQGVIIDANRSIQTIQQELRAHIERVLTQEAS